MSSPAAPTATPTVEPRASPWARERSDCDDGAHTLPAHWASSRFLSSIAATPKYVPAAAPATPTPKATHAGTSDGSAAGADGAASVTRARPGTGAAVGTGSSATSACSSPATVISRATSGPPRGRTTMRCTPALTRSASASGVVPTTASSTLTWAPAAVLETRTVATRPLRSSTSACTLDRRSAGTASPPSDR